MDSRPNVVWITLESTRADHTSLDGYDRYTTPNLQRMADAPAGRSFECLTSGIWTASSSASILTGTYPSRHGVGMDRDVLPDELDTVPERLGDVGYDTACLSPNAHLSPGTGLDRGFDRFSWISRSTLMESVGARTLLKYALQVRRHGPGLSLDPARHSSDFLATDVAKRWMESTLSEPFFLYAHLGGPHHPYYPPRRLLERFLDDVDLTVEEAEALAGTHHERLDELIAHGCELDDEEWAALTALYDATIAHVDEMVGSLFDYVRDSSLEDTIFVVTADHGELFGEKGMLAHKVVVDDALARVPLVTHGFDEVTPYDGSMVQHVDVATTLLEHVGARTDGFQGIDLRRESREYGFVQRGARRYRKNRDRFHEINPGFDASKYHDGTLHAIRSSEFKFLKSDDRTELFDLPDEQEDVSERYPQVASSLEATLDEWLDTTGRPVDATADGPELTDAMRKQLSDLGYIVD